MATKKHGGPAGEWGRDDGGEWGRDDGGAVTAVGDSTPPQILLERSGAAPDPRLLRESEELFRTLVESAPDALLISDQAGTILLANAVADAVFGYAHGELRGQTIEALIPHAQRGGHADHRASYFRAPSVRAMGASRSLSAKRNDGTEFPAEISLSPIRTQTETLVISIVRDVTARRRVEETLRLQGVAMNCAANGVLITDVAGKIQWANPAFSAMSGWSLAELEGQPASILKSGRHAEGFFRTLWDTVLSGHTWKGEIVNARKDGTLYVEEQTIAPVPDDRGRITHFVAIKTDVTERRREQAELARMNERLRTELADAAAFVRSVMPAPVNHEGVELDWIFKPSTELGGDGLGYHVRRDGKLALYLLDVCGHGLAAALLSVAVLTALRSGRLAGAESDDPTEVLSSLNDAFPATLHGGLHFTAWLGVLDLRAGVLRHASGGHPGPILLEPGRRRAEIGVTGPILGVDPSATWQSTETTVSPGSKLFVFTDGAYELTRPDGTIVPYDHFELAVEAAALSSRPLESLVDFAEKTSGSALLADDLTVLLLQTPPPA